MARTALYRHYDAADRLIYVGISDCLSARDKQHVATSHWHDAVARSETEWHPDRTAALLAEWEAIRDESPIYNVRRAEPFKVKPPARPKPPQVQMALAEYLATAGTKQGAFGEMVGLSRSYTCELLHGNRVPSLDVAKRIATVTRGAVPLRSWANFAAIADAIAAEDAAATRGAV